MPIECHALPADATVYREVITIGTRAHVIASDLAELKPGELEQARTDYAATGACDHALIYDVAGYPYHLRHCAVCGSSRGLV